MQFLCFIQWLEYNIFCSTVNSVHNFFIFSKSSIQYTIFLFFQFSTQFFYFFKVNSVHNFLIFSKSCVPSFNTANSVHCSELTFEKLLRLRGACSWWIDVKNFVFTVVIRVYSQFCDCNDESFDMYPAPIWSSKLVLRVV